MHSCWSEHFHPSNFALKHENPRVFVTSEWQYDKNRPTIFSLLVRWAIFITFFVIWLLSITMQDAGGRRTWPIYLTNWGFTLCLLQSCIRCIMLTVTVIEASMPYQFYYTNKVLNLHPLYWCLHVMATSVAFTITIIYWTIIYKAEGDFWQTNTNTAISTMNFMVHGFNSILMLFEFWIVSHEVRLLHCIYPLLFAITYSSFTAIYYVCGGTTKNGSRYIYSILKWDEPGVTIAICIAAAILMTIIHVLTFFMHFLKRRIVPPIKHWIHSKLFRSYEIKNTY